MKQVEDPAKLRQKAREARQLAESEVDSTRRGAHLFMASEYERLAAAIEHERARAPTEAVPRERRDTSARTHRQSRTR